MDTLTMLAPSAWAPYLINGDSSGLDDDETATVDAWIESLGVIGPVSCKDAGFCHVHDARQFAPYAADCQAYTFYVP